jgi:uncharacterized protein HemX
VTETAVLSLIAIVISIAIPLGGYFLATIHGQIKSNAAAALSMHDSSKQATRDAEARCMTQIKDTEQRAERGDERVMQHVNSQFSEINQQLREIRQMLTERQHP